VDAARGLSNEQEVGVPVELARQHDLLLVPAREGRGREQPVPGPDVILGDLTLEARGDGGAVQDDEAVVHAVGVVSEDRTLAAGERNDEPHAMAVLGHVREPALAPASRRPCVAVTEGLRLPEDLARRRGANARQRLEQLGLSVASDTGHADDLAASY